MADGLGRITRWRWPAQAALALVFAVGMHAADAGPQTHTIAIEGMRFNPETLTVHRGDRIVWHNKDLVPHTATAVGAFDSKSIAANEAWTYVAHQTGMLAYTCSFHPTMKGTLKVQ